MQAYHHKQEVWDARECARRARRAPRDAWGNKPPKGIIAYVGSNYAQYGQTVRYNGGIVVDNDWYQSEHRPLPIIPDTYEFYVIPAWGKAIRKKL